MMFEDFIKDSIKPNDKYILEKIDSEQFNLSGKILELESKLKMDQETMATRLNISYKKLLKMESADTSISTSEYNYVITKFRNMLLSNPNSYFFKNSRKNISKKINIENYTSDDILQSNSKESVQAFDNTRRFYNKKYLPIYQYSF